MAWLTRVMAGPLSPPTLCYAGHRMTGTQGNRLSHHLLLFYVNLRESVAKAVTLIAGEYPDADPATGALRKCPIKCALLVTAGRGFRRQQMWAVPILWSLSVLQQAPPLGFPTSFRETTQGRLGVLSFCDPRGWSPSSQPSFFYLEVYSVQQRPFFTDQRSDSGTGMKQSMTWGLLRGPVPPVKHLP